MRFSVLAGALAATSAVSAQSSPSVCDKYTTALLKQNTPANQYKLLNLLVNTVVIGNYTKPNVGIAVPGILAPGEYMGEQVNLAPYFSGALASSNRGGSSGVSVNFLDGGGATPIKNNMPADDQTSNQYKLLTHLYQFFGYLLNCSGYSKMGFPAYAGHASMYNVHKFMDLDAAQMGYFIEQVGLAAESFGVSKSDATTVGNALTKLFDYKCSPATTVIPDAGPQLQSICINSTCPADPKQTCAAYPDNGVAKMPMAANSSSSSSSSSSATPAMGSSSASATPFTGAGSKFGAGLGAAAAGAFGLAFAL